MKHSQEQIDIFNFLSNDTRNLVVRARAGVGKTSTIINSLKFLDTNKEILMSAFNKDIADELKQRIPTSMVNVTAQTFNSIGHRSLPNLLSHKKLNLFNGKKTVIVKQCVNKYIDMNMEILDEEKINILTMQINGIKELLSFVCRMGITPKNTEIAYTLNMINYYVNVQNCSIDYEMTINDLKSIIGKYDINVSSEVYAYLEPIIELCLHEVISRAFTLGEIDFDDQLYLPCVCNAPLPKYDIVFVDECQDLSPIRLDLITRLLKYDEVGNCLSRIVFVGDDMQCLYGFTGSDTEIFDKIDSIFNPHYLPLTTTYRCSHAVVREANRYVNDLRAYDSNSDGSVSDVTVGQLFKFASHGDVVLCRINAPLMSLAWQMVFKGVKVKLMGRDIGSSLISLIKRFKTNNVAFMLAMLNELIDNECKKLIADDKEAIASALRDKQDCIERIVAMLPNADVISLCQSIEGMFADKTDTDCLTFSSIHKSKGLTFNNVWFINPEIIPLKHAKMKWQIQQEYNCAYVAITRAKYNLYNVSIPMKKDY